MISSVRRSVLFAAAMAAAALGTAGPAGAQKQEAIGVTETIASHNPLADSVSLASGIWCQVYGCLGVYDFTKGEYVGSLAENWEVDKADPSVWIFRLKRGQKRQNDGKELTADDVVHSFDRTMKDPQSRRQANVAAVKEMQAVDRYTVKMITKGPTAPLLEYLFMRFFIMGKDLHDTHGAREADRRYPWGWGPYRLKDLVVGERIVLEKDPAHPDAKPENPDILMFRIMREAEQRVTALLNNEIQIAQFIPPHLASRIDGAGHAKMVPDSSVEIMFLAMNPNFKPWDDRLLRQAVCHAIDRPAIVKNVLRGQAQILNGPIGPGQYGFDAAFARAQLTIPYDPAKARELLARSGYKGEPVELETPVGRYINDKQIAEAIVPMLQAVGINARLKTPEWTTLWAAVQKGRTPFYYMGRGSVVDPSVALAQYFETGGSPRIGISDPEIDRTLRKERETFDPAERKAVLNQAFKAIVDSSAACFMWRHNQLYGMAKNIDYRPTPTGHVFGIDIAVR